MISLIVTIWKPISSFVSGLIVGSLFAIVLVYILIRMFIHKQLETTVLEEWIDFPALDAMLTKVDKEDKNTNIQVRFLFLPKLNFIQRKIFVFVR